jgi:hypothetical protein
LFAALGAVLVACERGDGGSGSPAPSLTAATTAAPTPTIAATATPPPDLASLIDTRGSPPENDPIALAARYRRTFGPAPAARPFAGEPALGSSRDFTIARITGATLAHVAPPDSVTITATLQAVTPHAYFYTDDAIQADPAAAREAAALFESTVWPAVTAAFGEPAAPGVDGDPRIIILQADVGGGVGGYYSGDDAYVKAVRPLSNEAEMVYLDRTLRPGGAAFNVVLAHEFQHLLQHLNDPGEESWVNEGLSENALLLAGGVASTIDRFALSPETQLNDFDTTESQARYGAGAAFLRYVADRVGAAAGLDQAGRDAVLGGIAREKGDGPAGIDAYLAAEAPAFTFRSLFADWIVANVVDQSQGPYANLSRTVDAQVRFELTPGDSPPGEARQFGTDYYGLTGVYGGGDYVLRFAGVRDVAVLPPVALEEGPVWWSNAGEGVDTTLTYRARVGAGGVLAFRSWYDIEPWYDFGYVSVSTDGGLTWEALPGDRTTAEDPVRLAVGPGRYGVSGGGEEPAWVDERVDLSRFAGQDVLLRFEYVTDGGTHGRGWAVRDPRLEGGGSSLEASPDAAGWVYVDRPLRQEYIVRLILTRDDGSVEVRDLVLDAAQAGELRFSAAGVTDALVAVAGATEGTNELAPYTLELAAP